MEVTVPVALDNFHGNGSSEHQVISDSSQVMIKVPMIT
jgi:hypothetical protein